MRKGRLVLIAGAVAVWLGVPAGAALAELRVVELTVPSIAADAVFADGAVFDLATGQKLKLLKTPGNSTHDIAGPYKGTLDAYQPACGWMEKLRGKCGGQYRRHRGRHAQCQARDGRHARPHPSEAVTRPSGHRLWLPEMMRQGWPRARAGG